MVDTPEVLPSSTASCGLPGLPPSTPMFSSGEPSRLSWSEIICKSNNLDECLLRYHWFYKKKKKKIGLLSKNKVIIFFDGNTLCTCSFKSYNAIFSFGKYIIVTNLRIIGLSRKSLFSNNILTHQVHWHYQKQDSLSINQSISVSSVILWNKRTGSFCGTLKRKL